MLEELQNNADFQKLSPEAKGIVIDRLTKENTGFKSLSPEAQTIVKQKLTGQSQDRFAKATPEPLTPALVDAAKSGFASTLATPGLLGDMLISPVRLIQHAASKITDSVPPPDYLGYSKVWKGEMDNWLGVQHLPTPKNEYGKESKSNEYLMKGTEFLGAGLVPGIGVVTAAERKLAAALVELIGTGVSATGAVEGKELGGSLAQKVGVDPQRGQAIGEFLGSLTGPVAVAGAVNAAQKATSKSAEFVSDKTGITGISKDAQKRAGEAMAIKQIKESLEAAPASRANLEEAVALQEKIPGFKPTLGQASGAPGVMAIEERIANSTPQSLAKAAETKLENTQALDAFKTEKFPDSAVSPKAAVESKYSQMVKAEQSKLDSIEKGISDLAAKQERFDTASVGSKLRELRGEAANVSRGVKNAAYRDVYDAAEQAGLKADVSDVRALIKDVAGSDANAAQVMPSLYRDVSDAVTKYKPKEVPQILGADGLPMARTSEKIDVPFEALHSMEKRANADLAAAIASGDNYKAHLVGKVKDAISDKIKAFEGAEFGDVAEKLRIANQKNTDYARLFKEGLGGRIGPSARNKWGAVTNDEDVVRSLIFNSDNKRGAQEFLEIFGSNPEAHSQLRNGVLDMFSKAAVRDGQIKPALAETFMRQHSAQLEMFPAIKKELEGVDKLNDALLARRAQVMEQQKAIDKSVIAKIAKSEDVDSVINSALTDRKEMLVLVNQAKKTPEAINSLSRAVAEQVAKQKDPFQFLVENELTLKPLLNKLDPNHFDNLKTLAKAEELMTRTRVPEHVNLEKMKDIAEQAVGTSGKGILSRLMNVHKGYMSPEYAAADIGGRYFYKTKMEEANKIMEAAIYDPEMAKVLVNMKKQDGKSAVNSLTNHAYAHGIRVGAVATGEEERRK